MSVGLGTYAFFWQHSPDASTPLDLRAMFARTVEAGVGVFQICDYAPLQEFSNDGLADLGASASELGLTLELGVRGIREPQLQRYLEQATALGAGLVRSMLFSGDDRPTLDEARGELRNAMPAFEAAGVKLALETYEQVATPDLVGLVEGVGSDRLGICLDVANTIARLENQREVIDRVADRVLNLHVKDFHFQRAAGLVGFELTGERLGDGLLELDYLIQRVDPVGRNLSMIVEHWLPWQRDEAETVALEQAWTARSVQVLESIQQAHKSTG